MRFNLRTVVWIGFLLSTGLFLGGAEGQGCGGKSVFESMADDGSDEAQLEKARIALDEGEFADAVEILADLCGTDYSAPSCDPEVVSLYASAFSGRAGLDVFDLIQEAADRPVAPGSSYTLFSTHFSDPDSVDVGDMNKAVLLLLSLSARTPGQGLQLAVATVVDLVVLLGSETGGYGADGRPVSIPTAAELDLSVIEGVSLISRVLRDVNNMDTGLDEAGIGNENISGHIREIQEQLAGADSTAVESFLNTI
ncbi:hypothetical protein [Candidatus Manganitrophus noduliformans]|uniref:Uncharacterized protein n=1 Tax=Candidatus Manganitrophus noduliformans TaxID=2606439 RepID=A0A7X6DQR5_9BACT|nr:hypothetical protein [Candidatus Manganitrophus noduliformans]NKE71597.1 hypothetical protein [Candidatus Manganitrophus noduliformans]